MSEPGARSTAAACARSSRPWTRSGGASICARFDAAIFSLDAVAADLGYGDVRPLPGSVAWIDRLRREGKRIGVVARASARRRRWSWPASPIASTSSCPARRRPSASPAPWRSSPSSPPAPSWSRRRRTSWTPRGPQGVELAIGVVRGAAAPEQLRRAGAVTIVADLQELLGPAAA